MFSCFKTKIKSNKINEITELTCFDWQISIAVLVVPDIAHLYMWYVYWLQSFCYLFESGIFKSIYRRILCLIARHFLWRIIWHLLTICIFILRQTAVSYICSTNVTQFLELLLRTPGIDINKPDIELNTPLHHAAESGQVGSLKLLLSESRVQIDAKNVFGFTPLMKVRFNIRIINRI